jgi:hypothetical protein
VLPWYVVAHGQVVAETTPVASTVSWPGRAPETVDFIRQRDLHQATWRGLAPTDGRVLEASRF